MPAHWSPPLPATPSLPALASTDRPHVSALPAVGVLRVEGADAYTFLQGQVTTDLREVEKGRVLPGAVCSLKGRVLFSFLAVPVSATAVWLLLPDEQAGDALLHLKKYAVFSKVTLTVGETLAVAGLLAIGDETAAGLALPAPGMAGHDARLLLARVDATRCLLLGEAAALADWLANAALPLVAANAWQLADIRAGLANIPSALRDRHQPQELNYPA
ncbi:MAG: YgfZ/GcvT domain-containing protein, partial [Moraxellaceae bacterium]